MKRLLLLISSALYLGLTALPGSAQEVFTLGQCIGYGIENSAVLQAARFRVSGAGQDVKAARADFLPNVTSSASFSRVGSLHATGSNTEADYLDQDIDNYTVRLSQILYAGSRIYNTYTRSEAQEEVAEAEQAFTRLGLIYNIEHSFFKLMKAKQDVVAFEDMVKRLEAGRNSAKAYVDKQMAPYVQLLQAEVDLDDAKQKLSQGNNMVERERSKLFALMNMDFSPDTGFTGGLDYYGTDDGLTLENSWKKAVVNRPDLVSLEKQVVMAEKSASIAFANYLPTIRLDVAYYDHKNDYDDLSKGLLGYTDRDQQNRYWTAGISASWNMFDGGKALYEKRKYKFEVKRIRSQIEDAKNSLKQGIRTALFDLSEAETRIEGASAAVNTAKEYYEREDKRFQVGIATLPSLLDAQARLTRADGNYNQALLDYQLARSELNYMVGEPSTADRN